MARKSPAEKLKQIERVTRAWQRMAPRAVFYGMTLAQFKAAMRPSVESRRRIADLRLQLEYLTRQRNFADNSMHLIQGVVNGVKGNPRFGADSPLYAAMGYVPDSARRKRRKKRKASA